MREKVKDWNELNEPRVLADVRPHAQSDVPVWTRVDALQIIRFWISQLCCPK